MNNIYSLIKTLAFCCLSFSIYAQNEICESFIDINLDQEVLFSPGLGEGSPFYPNNFSGSCIIQNTIGGKEQMYRFTAPQTGIYNIQALSTSSNNTISYSYKLGDENICDTSDWNCLGQQTLIRSISSVNLYEGQILLLLVNARLADQAVSQTFKIVGPRPFACQTITPIEVGQINTFQTDTLVGARNFANDFQNSCYFLDGIGGQEKMYLFTAPYSGNYRFRTTFALNGNFAGYFYTTDIANVCATDQWNCLLNTNSFANGANINLEANESIVILANAERFETATNQSFTLEYHSNISLPFEIETIYLDQLVSSSASIPSTIYNGNASDIGCLMSGGSNGFSAAFYRFTPPTSGYYILNFQAPLSSGAAIGYMPFPEDLNNISLMCWGNSQTSSGSLLPLDPIYFEGGQELLIGAKSNALSHNFQFTISSHILNCENEIEISCDELVYCNLTGGNYSNPLVEPCGTFGNFREQHYKMVAQESGYYTYRAIDADNLYKILYYVGSADETACSIIDWQCQSSSTNNDQAALLNIYVAQNQVLHLMLINTLFQRNNTLFKLECQVAAPCENIIEISTGIEVVFDRLPSAYPEQPYMIGSCENNSSTNDNIGLPQIYRFTATSSETHNIRVNDVSSPSAPNFSYYYMPATNDPCLNDNWICVGKRSTTGIVGNISLTAGTSYYVLVLPYVSYIADRQTFSINPQSVGNAIVKVDIGGRPCFGESTGDIFVEVNNNSLPYTVTWSDLGPTPENILVRNDLADGEYGLSVNINGANEYYATYTITELDTFYTVTTFTSPSNEEMNNGVLEIVVFNEGLNYQYNGNINATTGTTNVYDLTTGEFCFFIESFAGCVQDYCVNITGENTPDLVFSATNVAVECAGSNTGSLSINVAGGVPPYNIEWDDAPTATNQFQRLELPAGNFTFTIFDSNNNQITGSAFVASNSPITPLEVASPIIFGSAPGEITITPVGGGGIYQIDWNHIDLPNEPFALSNLEAGEYCYTITDQIGCSIEDCVIVNEIEVEPLEWSGIVMIDPCLLNPTQYIDPAPVGGLGPFTYDWEHISGNFNNGYVDVPNTAGQFTLQITDALGTKITEFFAFETVSNLTVTEEISPSIGYNSSNGSIALNISTAQPSYTITWEGNEEFNGLSTVTNIPAGDYIVKVTDAIGCNVIETYQVEEIVTNVVLDIDTIAPYCPNNSDGQIQINVLYGEAPYIFDWEHIPGNNNPQNLENLIAGNYSVTVTDNNGLTGDYVIDLTSTNSLAITLNAQPASSSEIADGVIEAIISGGTPPYQIIWSHLSNQGPITIFEVDGLNTGYYTAIVEDAEGCFVTAGVNVNDLTSIQMINSQHEIKIYPNPSTGLVSIDSTSNFKITNVEVFNNLGQIVSGLIPQASKLDINLETGVYYLKVTTENNVEIHKIQIL